MSWQDAGPTRDPLDEAARNAARRLFCGQQLDPYDWDALKQKAISELMEFDAITF